MKVEREIAGFALPFTAGVILATCSNYGIYDIQAFSPISVLAATSILMLMHPSRHHLPTYAIWLLIGTAALSAGLVCGHTAVHISVSTMKSELSLMAEGYGIRMQSAIDDIPFKDARCNAIAKALVTGERSNIPKEIVQSFRDSGASHILALSGLHLGIIYAIITRSLSIFSNNRRLWILRSILVISSCGFYTIATGAGPSIVRAFLFILLAEIGRLTQRNHSTGQLLFSALILQLVFTPLSIRSAGFQLSYAAMAGIAFILPWLQSLWPGSIYDDHPFTIRIRKIWNACAMSISCQITTAPVAFLYFRTFPHYFLITNLIALPLTGIIIPAILTTLALNGLGICPSSVTAMTEALITALISALETIAGMQTS